MIPNQEKGQFKKGQTGNPNGRPKKVPDLDNLLADVLGDEKDGLTMAKAIIMALCAKAKMGDVRAAEVLLDRAYGKAKQGIDITSKGESITKTPDLSKLSNEDLAVMVEIEKKMYAV